MPKICRKCGEQFPYKIKINGKTRNLGNRKYCLKCSPFGQHNTKKLHKKEVTTKKLRKKVDSTKTLCVWHNCDNLTTNKFCSINCKQNHYIYYKRKKRKKKSIEYKGGKCDFCGYSKCDRGLTFHHKDDNLKSFSISRSYGKSWEKLKKELDKCILACHNCHSKLHYKKLVLSDCKNKNSYQVQKFRKNRKIKAVEYKGKKCQKCGYNQCVDALIFHHINANKKDFGISANGITRSWNKTKKELDKCILLCSNCHMELHDKLEKNKINSGNNK